MNFRNVGYFGLATCTHCPSVSVISAISVISPRQDGQGGMVVLVRTRKLRGVPLHLRLLFYRIPLAALETNHCKGHFGTTPDFADFSDFAKKRGSRDFSKNSCGFT